MKFTVVVHVQLVQNLEQELQDYEQTSGYAFLVQKPTITQVSVLNLLDRITHMWFLSLHVHCVHVEWNVQFTDCLPALICDQTYSLLEAGKLQALRESHACTCCCDCMSAREVLLNSPPLSPLSLSMHDSCL